MSRVGDHRQERYRDRLLARELTVTGPWFIDELIKGRFYHAENHHGGFIALPLHGTGAAGSDRGACVDTMFRIIARKLLHGVTGVKELLIVKMKTRKTPLD